MVLERLSAAQRPLLAERTRAAGRAAHPEGRAEEGAPCRRGGRREEEPLPRLPGNSRVAIATAWGARAPVRVRERARAHVHARAGVCMCTSTSACIRECASMRVHIAERARVCAACTCEHTSVQAHEHVDMHAPCTFTGVPART